MNIPFSIDDFLNVFKVYNESVWPIQVILNIVAFALIILTFKKFKHSDKVITLVLSFLWMWMGVAYHLILFTKINIAAYAFAAIFILQSMFFLYAGIKGKFIFLLDKNNKSILGLIFIFYALIFYPLLGNYLGHSYPLKPTFGLPCPTTIFTFGILLIVKNKIPPYYLGIPIIWSIVGFTAALKLGMCEDIGLFITGIVAGSILIFDSVRKEIV